LALPPLPYDAAARPLENLRQSARAERTALEVRLRALREQDRERQRQELVLASRRRQAERRQAAAGEAEAAYRRLLSEQFPADYAATVANLKIDIAALAAARDAALVPESRKTYEARLAETRQALEKLNTEDAQARAQALREADALLARAAQNDEQEIERIVAAGARGGAA
jgi:hypothetical protein